MQVKEITVKSCLTSSKLSDYVINPYLGCAHGCVYCYATFMRRFHDIAEPWGSFVHVKINSPELLARELTRAKAGRIWLSSVTDAYLPLEAEYRLTRRILEVLAASPRTAEFPLEILTKSALVRRDFDLLRALKGDLGCSINTLDDSAARTIEPLAAPPSERVATLRAAHDAGISTYAFLSPVLPGITDLAQIFKEVRFCREVWVELLNTKPAVMSRVWPLLRKHYPALMPAMREYVNAPVRYYEQTKTLVGRVALEYGVSVREVVRHDS